MRKMGVNDSNSINQGRNHGSRIDETISFSDGISNRESRSVGTNVSVVREPIIFPHELATLKDILLMMPEGFCRVNKLPYHGA